MLQREQFFFDGQATSVAGELSIAADHAMTRDHDGNRIGAVGQAYCPRSVRIAQTSGEFAIGNCFAVRESA